MLKSEKENIVRELNEKFGRAKSAVLAEFSKLNVDTVTRLRKKLREGGVEYRVLKNTLSVKAQKDAANAHQPIAVQFQIKGELWAQGAPEALYIKTEVDLETGQCELKRGANG